MTILPPKFNRKTINRMKELTIKSEKDKLEYGGTLCNQFWGKTLLLENECVGTKCKITYSKDPCKYNNPKAGTFHTHPNDTTFDLSTTDIINTKKIGCIGYIDTKKNTNIKCVIPKLEISKEDQDKLLISTKKHDNLIDQINILNKDTTTKEEKNELYRLEKERQKFLKEKMDYVNKYFKTFDIKNSIED